MSCQIPTSVMPGSAMDLEVLTAYVKHAQISSLISQKLASAKSFQQSPSTLIQTVQKLSQQLQQWRDTLPYSIRIGRPIRTAELPRNVQVLHIAKLHFAYYGSLMAIHTIFAYPWISAMLEVYNPRHFGTRYRWARIQWQKQQGVSFWPSSILALMRLRKGGMYFVLAQFYRPTQLKWH
jgi:hypothetical protein